MTLKEVYEYIGPLLPDDQMAAQEAALILHFPDGSVEVVKKDEGVAALRCRRLDSDASDRVLDGDGRALSIEEPHEPLLHHSELARIATSPARLEATSHRGCPGQQA